MKIGAMDNVLAKPWTELFEEAARLGFDGVELDVKAHTYQGSEVWSAAGRKALLARSRQTGVEIASLCLADTARLMVDPATHEQGIQAVADARNFCAELGAGVILYPMGKEDSQSEEDAIALWRDGFHAAFAKSADSPVLVGMESVGRKGRSADGMWAVMKAVDSPLLGVYYDVGNAAYQGFDNDSEIAKLGDRIFQVHVKEIGAEMGEGKLDFPALFAALKQTGFDGYLVLETNAGDDPAANAARNLAFVRGLL
jgi:sugar phosphate isomerase/epimerase